MELIQTIALLCQLHTGSTNKQEAEEMQKTCQVYFVTCIQKSNKLTDPSALIQCIKERK